MMSFPDSDTHGDGQPDTDPFAPNPFGSDPDAPEPFTSEPLGSPFGPPAAYDEPTDDLAFSADPFLDDPAAIKTEARLDEDIPAVRTPDVVEPVRDARNEPVGLDRKVVLAGLLIAGTVVCLLLVVFGGGEPSAGSPDTAVAPTPAGAYIDDGDAGYYAEAGLSPVGAAAGTPAGVATPDGDPYGSAYDAQYGSSVPASDYATTQAYPGSGGSSGASSGVPDAGGTSAPVVRPAESAFDKAVLSPLLAGRGARPAAPERRAVPDGLSAEQTQDLTFMREVADMFRPEGGAAVPPASSAEAQAQGAPAPASRAPESRRADRGPQSRASTPRVVQQSAVGLALQAGTVIPAALVTGMNSELPGTVVAQTTRNVYDSRTQRDVLIPAGTRLVGAYDDQIAYGQNRALVAWSQMIFPDGTTVELPGLPGTDLQGNAGFADRVDRHYGRIVGSALLLATIGAGVELAAPNSGGFSQNPSPQEVASRQIALEVSRVATEIVRRNMDVQPTIRISPGYRFYVLLARELPFDAPYRPRPSVRRFARPNR